MKDKDIVYQLERCGMIMNKRAKNILILAGLATAAMHILNRIEYSRSTSRNILSSTRNNPYKNNYYEWRFGKIRYTVRGKGTPILMIHDLTVGSSSYEFHRITDELSKTHEVYCIDLIGYGMSDKPDMTYTNFLFVQLITDFIKNVIQRKTDIIAVGDSVPVAIMSCHNDSEIINKIVAINPQSLFQLNQIPSKQTRILKFLMEVPILGTFIYNLHTSRAAFEKMFRKDYFYNPGSINESDLLAYTEAAHTSDHHSKNTYASYVGRYMNANIVHALKEVNNSIYIIMGENKRDSRTTAANYEYYNHAIESVFIRGAKHLVHLEKSRETLEHIKTFLAVL